MSRHAQSQHKNQAGGQKHQSGGQKQQTSGRSQAAAPPEKKRPVLEAYRHGGLAIHLMIIIGLILMVVGVLGFFLSWIAWINTGLIMGGLCLLASAVSWVEAKRRTT